MTAKQFKPVFSLFLLLTVALSAWPVYVISSVAVSHFFGMVGITDFMHTAPKRLLAHEFITGWRQSAPLALALGALAVIDIQLLIRSRFTHWLAGISLPLALMALSIVYFKHYGFELLPVFALAGLMLWAMLRFMELFSRFER